MDAVRLSPVKVDEINFPSFRGKPTIVLLYIENNIEVEKSLIFIRRTSVKYIHILECLKMIFHQIDYRPTNDREVVFVYSSCFPGLRCFTSVALCLMILLVLKHLIAHNFTPK